MSQPQPVALMWSGGKDAALVLDALQRSKEYQAEALLTTVIKDAETVTMHGTPLALIEAQAEDVGLPLHVMRVPPRPSNTTYEEGLERALAPLLSAGITTVAAGDIFLQDVKDYRASLLTRLGAEPLFPLWQQDTASLARQFIDAGYRAVITSVDTEQLDAAFAGRMYDEALLNDLSASVDPCGERGAFHTFVFGGPVFEQAIPIEVGTAYGTGRMRYVELAVPQRPE